MRGVRFNFVKRLVDFTPKDELMEIAGRIARLGWHVVIYFEAVDLPELRDFFTALPTTVVVDHMGRPDVSKPSTGPEFALFLDFMREHANVWAKFRAPSGSPSSGPPALNGERRPYRDFVPFARAVVEAFPDRVIWGTDWPHPNLKDHMPDDGLLVDFLPRSRRQPSCSGSCSSTIRCGSTGPRSWRLTMALDKEFREIPGTTIFDAEQARKGYWLNQFCMSLMKAENRARFKADERAYLDEWKIPRSRSRPCSTATSTG